MNQETIIIAGAIFASIYVITTIGYSMFRRYMELREKELEVQRVRLDDFRAHLERQLMDLNVRFASSEGRWKELNHLVVAGQNEKQPLDTIPRIPQSEFLRSHGLHAERLEIRQDLMFVLTPFHDNLQNDFQTVVQVGHELGLTVMRGDERTTQSDIFPQLLKLLVTAKVVVANISGRNPNVFYELGIAHALDKPVILLARSDTKIPFDVTAKRIVFYSSDSELREGLLKMLAKTMISTNS